MRRALFVSLPLAGLLALGLYACYRNTAPVPVQGQGSPGAAAGAPASRHA
jgi:hypothetical protein